MVDRARSPVVAPAAATVAAGGLPKAADVAAVLAAAALDAVIIMLLVRGTIGSAVLVLAHLGVVGLIGLQLAARRRGGGDTTMLALAALATFCVGPLGSIGALVSVLLAPLGAGTTPLLQAWYRRIANSVETDPVTQLCDMVSIGRSVDLGGPPPTSFAAVMSSGSLAERQALLGLIARNFDVEYLAALKIALTSPEPVIRVQAAAVATKVQHALGRIVTRWAARPVDAVDPIDALGGIVELEACLGSGLIEAGDRAAAAGTLERLRSAVLQTTLAPDFKYRLLGARANPHQLPAIAAYADLLIGECRFKDLRNWRRLQHAGQLPGLRLRRSARRRRLRPPRLLEAAE